METGAEYLRVKPKDGHYESFYVKAAAPDGGKAFWIRYTVHKRPHAQPTASLWFTFFDRRLESGPRAGKLTVGSDRLSAPQGADTPWLRIAEAEIGPGRLHGRIDLEEFQAEWDLEFEHSGPPCQYLPRRWMYRAPFPRTKLLAPAPYTRYRGRLIFDGQEIEIDSWPGMVGHNWGAEHAERWVWLQGNGFTDGAAEGDYFDCAAARVKVAGRTLPWMAVGMVRLDGVEYRLGGPQRYRSTVVEARPGNCDFILPGDGVTVRGRLSAPTSQFVGWIYADPDGPEHHTINCSVCDLELTVERKGAAPRELGLPAAGAYELGMRETDHGIAIQPYGDG